MLDIYHAQIGEGNLVELIKICAPYIGEVQVADVPGRCEPGTGEINYPRIAQALHDIGTWAPSDLRPGPRAIANSHLSASAKPLPWRVSHLETNNECPERGGMPRQPS
jgi:hypothetical protein